MTTILIADDHQIFSEGLAEILSHIEGFSVLGTAPDGNRLLSLVKENTPDVVLLDISMPSMDGNETARHLKRDYPGVKVIMLTMHNTYEHISPLLELGIDGYVLKNAGKNELQKAIHTVMENGRYFSSDVVPVMLKGKEEEQFKVHLSSREQEILELIVEGLSTAEISEKLFISVRTVETHRRNINNKTETKNTAQLINFAVKNNLLKRK